MNQIGDIQYNKDSTYMDRVNRMDKAISNLDYAMKMKLSINYRNSKSISKYFSDFIEDEVPFSVRNEIDLFDSGDVIEIESANAKEHKNKLISVLERVIRKYPENEIAIIPTRNDSDIRMYLNKKGYEVTSSPLKKGLLVSSPQEVRGYERRAVIFIQGDNYTLNRNIKRSVLSYMAMSRARDALILLTCKSDVRW